MKNNPIFLVGAVVLGLIAITAVATVTSTTPKQETGLTTRQVSNADSIAGTEIPPASGSASESHGAVQPKPESQEIPAQVATTIQWETSYESALKKAKSTGKYVMVDFYADWCGACKHLDQNIYTASPVIAESAHFINVKVDADKRGDLQTKYQVSGLPTIVWLNAEGTEVKRLQGAPREAEYLVQEMQAARNQSVPDSVL